MISIFRLKHCFDPRRKDLALVFTKWGCLFFSSKIIHSFSLNTHHCHNSLIFNFQMTTWNSFFGGIESSALLSWFMKLFVSSSLNQIDLYASYFALTQQNTITIINFLMVLNQTQPLKEKYILWSQTSRSLKRWSQKH